MKKNKILFICAMIVIVGVVVLSCKAPEVIKETIIETVTETVTETVEVEVEVEVPAEEEVAAAKSPYEGETITVWKWPDDSGLLTSLFDEFTEETGIIVNHRPMTLDWNEYVTEIVTYLSSGSDEIDVYFSSEGLMPTYSRAGWMEPIDDVFPDLDDFPQDYIKQACQFEGQTYWIPQSLGFTTIYYNREIFDNAGVEIPEQGWTYEDLVTIGKQLTSDDIYAFLPSGAPIYITMDTFQFVAAWGGDLTDWHNPKTQAAIQFYYDLIHTHKIAPPNTAQQDYITNMETFLQGKGAMLFTWNNLKLNMEERFPEAFDNRDYWVVPMFKGGEKQFSMTSSWCYGIGSASQHKGAAKEFLKWMCSKDTMIKYSPKELPPRASALAETENLADPDMALIAEEYLSYAGPRQFYSENQSEFETIISDSVASFITDQVTLEEMVEQAMAKIAELK